MSPDSPSILPIYYLFSVSSRSYFSSSEIPFNKEDIYFERIQITLMSHKIANLELSMWEQAENKSELFEVFSCFVFVSVFKLQAISSTDIFLTKLPNKNCSKT